MGESKKILALAAALLMFAATAPAAMAAAMVTSSTAGVLINDGFEGDTVANPGTPTGWLTANPNRIAIENGSLGAPDPSGAYLGTKFLGFHGSAGQAPAAYQNFAAQTSGILTAQLAFYVPGDGGLDDANVFAAFLKSPSGPTSWETAIAFVSPQWITSDLVNTPDGSGQGVVYNYAGGNGYNVLTAGGTPYHFTLDAWHEATITYNIALGGATNALTVTIDGTTLDPMPTTSTLASGTVTGFSLYDNTAVAGLGFVDSIPEPASMGVLAIGGILLGRRNRTLSSNANRR